MVSRFRIGPTLGTRFAWIGFRIPVPLHLAGFRVVGLQISGVIQGIAAYAGDDVVTHDKRRHSAEVLKLCVRDLLSPALLAVLGVQRNKIAVWCFGVNPITQHGDTALADVAAFVRRIFVMPDFPPATRINGPHVVRHGEVKHAIHFNRRRLDNRAEPGGPVIGGAIHPGQRQRSHIRRVDLIQKTVPLPRIVAVVRRPTIGPRLHERLWGQFLPTKNDGRQQQYEQEGPDSHFKVSRYAKTSCICWSLYFGSSPSCAARGSCTSTVTFSREKERYQPAASCMETVNSSR